MTIIYSATERAQSVLGNTSNDKSGSGGCALGTRSWTIARTVRLSVILAKTKRKAKKERHKALGSLCGPNLSVFRIKLSGMGICMRPERWSLATEQLDELLDCSESTTVVVTVGRSVAVVVLFVIDGPVIACMCCSSISRL